MSDPNTPSAAVVGSQGPTIVWQKHDNVDQTLVQVTEDKILLCLNKQLERSGARGAWITPLCLLVSILATLTTSTFKDAVLKKEHWEALFYFGAAASFLWTAIALMKSRRAPSRDDLILDIVREMKGKAPPPPKPTIGNLIAAMTRLVLLKIEATKARAVAAPVVALSIATQVAALPPPPSTPSPVPPPPSSKP